MNPRRKRRLYIAIASVTSFAIALGLILYALGQNIDLFYTPSEIVDGKAPDGVKPHIGQRLRIGGLVVPGSVKRDEETLEVSFNLIDSGPLVNVVYTGLLPDLFREGQGIVAQGILVGPSKIEAFEVLAKHDEEYMPPEVAEAIKGIKHKKPDYSSINSTIKGE
ncbi:MAG: cytochrome c-type biogenesis protein CcmE [Alteromonadaceae bacterium]|jgi:cytochrome c-type biogenesis protein CcmE